MSKISIEGNALGSGTFTIASPNSNTSRTLTLPDNTGTIVTQNSTPAFASTIGVGGATPSTSGAGITFPAAQSASSNANTLDDYEEGTWTPTFSSTGASFSYNDQYGSYTRVGRMVLAQFYLRASASGTTSNTVEMQGLPFTADNLNVLHQSGGGTWFSGTTCQVLVINNSTRVELWKGGQVALNLASDISGRYLVGMVMYQAA